MVRSSYLSLSPGTGISFRYVDCVALPNAIPGKFALLQRKSTFGHLLIISLKPPNDRKFLFETCCKVQGLLDKSASQARTI